MGVGGSGKQSLARLAGHICGYATTTIVISGNYNMANFREDLQKMYKRAGVKVSGICPAATRVLNIRSMYASLTVAPKSVLLYPCQLRQIGWHFTSKFLVPLEAWTSPKYVMRTNLPQRFG